MLFKQLPLSLQILVIIICIKGAILQTNEFFGNYKILVLKNPSELEEVYPKSCQELNEYFQINFGWYFISKDGVTVQKVLCYFERNKVSSLGLTHFWPFHNHTKDIFGGKNHIGLSKFTNDRESNENSALLIDKANHFLPAYDYFSGNYTFSFWIRLDNFIEINHMAVFACGDSRQKKYFVLRIIANGEVQLLERDNNTQDILSIGSFEVNEWNHVSLTFNNEVVCFYKNGIKISSKTWEFRNEPYIREFYKFGNTLTNIALSDFMIFNRELNPDEVKAFKELPSNIEKQVVS